MEQVATKGTALEHSKLPSRLPARCSLTQQPEEETFQLTVFVHVWNALHFMRECQTAQAFCNLYRWAESKCHHIFYSLPKGV